MRFSALGLALVVGCALSSQAIAFVPWTPGPGGQVGSSGSASFFNWSDGGSDNGLFGSPRLINDNFIFFPSGFRAQSVAGAPSLVGDRLQVRLTAHTGRYFTEIRIREFGDYGILGGGQVDVNGAMFVTNMSTGAVLTDTLVTTPAMPISTPGAASGAWTSLTLVDLPDPGQLGFPWTDIFVILDNNLIAISMPNGAAFIEKKVVGTGIIIEIIPSPGALALLALSGVVAVRRRR
jgi:uncharacterized protein (TIGR03382 family)